MKNNLKKLSLFILSFMLLMTSSLQAATPTNLLSLEQAIESAIRYSNDISLNYKQNELLKEQLNAIAGASFVDYQTVYLNKAKNEQQKQILKDRITYDITKRYQAMVLLQKEIENLNASIALNNQKLQHMALQKRLGLISKTQYEQFVIQLNMQKNTLSSKKEALLNDQNYFKILTGKDVSTYTLDDTLFYEPFRITGPIDSYINNKISQYLKYDKDLAELKSDNLLTAGSEPMPLVTYLGQKYAIDSQFEILESSQKSLRQGLMTTYSSLLNIEEQIATLKGQLELLEEQNRTAKLQYDLGMITALDYNTQVLSVQDTACTLRNLTNNYVLLIQAIQKPWAATGSM